MLPEALLYQKRILIIMTLLPALTAFPRFPSPWSVPSAQLAQAKTTLFVYGSLLNANSFEKTTGVQPHYTPATLAHHQRAFTAKVPVVSEEKGQVVNGLFLDLKPKATGHVNGALVEVTPDQFQRLQEREAGYRWANVSNDISMADHRPVGQPVLTPDFPDEKGYHPGDPNCFVMKRYVDLANKGVANLGRTFEQTFKATTDPTPAPLLDGAYRIVTSVRNALWPQEQSSTV
jgi:Gamma-glutamyl cyclotransferase, AIG2-like